MADEFERKFIHKKGLEGALNFVDLLSIISTSQIEQGYFTDQYADIVFNWQTCQWQIRMKKNDLFLFVDAKESELESLKSIIKNFDGNLIDIEKSSFRMRLKNDKVLFTAKFAGSKEFEYKLNLSVQQYRCWVEQLPKVTKSRVVFDYDNQCFEFDWFFGAGKYTHLFEVEFETEQEKEDYVAPDFLQEVYYSNKTIAIESFGFA